MTEPRGLEVEEHDRDHDDDNDYEILGDAAVLTRNGKATATEANRGKG